MVRGVIKLAALAGLAKQARDYARKNPDSVSSAIGKVESAIGGKVGPKYSDHVTKGGNALRSGLGLAQTSPTTEPRPTTKVTPASGSDGPITPTPAPRPSPTSSTTTPPESSPTPPPV